MKQLLNPQTRCIYPLLVAVVVFVENAGKCNHKPKCQTF